MTILTADFQPDPAGHAADERVGSVAIVVPCYNEAQRFDTARFGAFLSVSAEVHLVLVDDGSRDDTLEVLRAFQSAHPGRCTVLALSRNAGKAEAVRQGLIHASGRGAELVGYWDADLATPLDAIDDFLRVARKYAEISVVFGSRRALLGHKIERSVKRRAISRVCALLARMAVGLPVGDTQCGAKLLRNTSVLRDAIEQPFTAGWLFDVELFSRLSGRLAGAQNAFYEFPLSEWEEVPGSKVSGAAIVRCGFQMLRLIAEARLGLPALAAPRSPHPSARVVAAARPVLPRAA